MALRAFATIVYSASIGMKYIAISARGGNDLDDESRLSRPGANASPLRPRLKV
jgi:hypothetical protein